MQDAIQSTRATSQPSNHLPKPERNIGAETEQELYALLELPEGVYRESWPCRTLEDALELAIWQVHGHYVTLGALKPEDQDSVLNRIYDLVFPIFVPFDQDGEVLAAIEREDYIYERTSYERRDEILDLLREHGWMHFPRPLNPTSGDACIERDEEPPTPDNTDSCELGELPTESSSVKGSQPEPLSMEEKPKPSVSSDEWQIVADDLEVAYYDEQTKIYWIQNNLGRWITITEVSLKNHLKLRGFSDYRTTVDLSPCQREIARIQLECSVAYAGRIAGLKKGVHVDSESTRYLVTQGPKLIAPVPGPYPTIWTIIENILDDPDVDQRPYFFGWLKCTLEALYAGVPRQGQAVVFAGPANSGKSFLQLLFTEMVGGSPCKPYQYMTGQTTFNADMFAGVHQMIEDESAPAMFQSKDLFTQRLKELVASDVKRCHPKNKQALLLRPLMRLTMSLNDDPENLALLPRLSRAFEDKLLLFRAGQRQRRMPIDTTTCEGRDRLWACVTAELPHFLHFIMNYEIPAELRASRFGVKHYHHPALVSAMAETGPEGKLLQLIDRLYFADSDSARAFESTAGQIEQALAMPGTPTAAEAGRNFFRHNSTCAAYLDTLSRTHPQRVQKLPRPNRPPLWRIEPASA